MSSINFSEIITIAIIVLVVFGPKQLPDLARKAGRFAARARSMIADAERELKSEYSEAIEPLREVKRDLDAAQGHLKGAVQEFQKDVSETGQDMREAARSLEREVNAPFKESVEDIKNNVTQAGRDVNEAARSIQPDPPSAEAGAGEALDGAVESGPAEAEEAS